MWFMIGIGLIGAGFYFGLRSLLHWMAAQSTGVIRRQGASTQKIERAVDPERFNALLKQRLNGLIQGLCCVVGGLAWLIYNFWALSTR